MKKLLALLLLVLPVSAVEWEPPNPPMPVNPMDDPVTFSNFVVVTWAGFPQFWHGYDWAVTDSVGTFPTIIYPLVDETTWRTCFNHYVFENHHTLGTVEFIWQNSWNTANNTLMVWWPDIVASLDVALAACLQSGAPPATCQANYDSSFNLWFQFMIDNLEYIADRYWDFYIGGLHPSEEPHPNPAIWWDDELEEPDFVTGAYVGTIEYSFWYTSAYCLDSRSSFSTFDPDGPGPVAADMIERMVGDGGLPMDDYPALIPMGLEIGDAVNYKERPAIVTGNATIQIQWRLYIERLRTGDQSHIGPVVYHLPKTDAHREEVHAHPHAN